MKVDVAAPGAFEDGTAALMELFAAPAATLLSHIQTAEIPERISESLQAALSAAQNRTGDLWLYYFGIGGSVGECKVEAYLQGLLSLPELQRNLLAIAANKLLVGHSGQHAPYSDELGSGDAPKDPPGPETIA